MSGNRGAWGVVLLPIAIGIVMALEYLAVGGIPNVDARREALSIAGGWIIWSPLIAIVIRLPLVGKRAGRESARRAAVALRIAATTVAVLIVERAAVTLMERAIWGSAMQTLSDILIDALFSASIVALAAALQYRGRSVQRETEAAKLAERMALVRLRFLLAQLQPHFLFNTLNGVLALLEEDAATAAMMLHDLAAFVEASFAHDAAVGTSVRREVELLQCYIAVERRRFPEAFRFESRIEGEALEGEVPPLLLQPLVENAIRHGMSSGDDCRVAIEIRRRAARLEIGIEDSGTMFSGSFHEGIGLSNTRQRLSAMYPDDHDFRINTSARGGARVEISIPYRVAATTVP